jgi:polysaccharide export outer membrane protein
MKRALFLITTLLLLPGLYACSSSGGLSATGSNAATGPLVPTSANTAAIPGGGTLTAVAGIPADPGSHSTYRIGPQDLLKIDVFQVAEFSTQERVNATGMITMPEIGDVQVGGLTLNEAEQRIAGRLSERVLQNPQVSIFVVESASQRVTVAGHVKRPGIYPLKAETTLMQAITLAGGIDDVGKKDEIVIFRKQSNGNTNAYVVNLAAIENGEVSDPQIVADDRVVVPQSGMRVLGKRLDRLLMAWTLGLL